MTATQTVLDLHKELIAIPSVSGQELEIANFVESRLRRTGANVLRYGENVIAWTGDSPRLLLNSHFDTVPHTSAWTREPHIPSNEDGKVFGLGSNDAKGCVAGMMCAFEQAASEGIRGLGLLLAPEEETGGSGTEVSWPWLQDKHGWNPDAIIVGEPTELQIGTSQSGLLVVELVAHGQACHAANAERLGLQNPVYALARDLVKTPNLGLPTLPQATMLTGAAARNLVPAEARAVLDVRTQPGQNHEDLIDRFQREFESEVVVRSRRLQPYACDPNARIIRTVESVVEGAETFHSPTMSDQVHFSGFNAVKFGPGVSARSHSSDEYILESEVIDGANAYFAICKEFLK